MRNRLYNRAAFTLAELMMGLLVMSIIMAIAIPNVRGMVSRSREQSLRQTLYTLRQTMAQAREDTGSYPISLSDLTSRPAPTNMFNDLGVSVANPQPTRWRGPYLVNLPMDPVSNTAFTYSVNSSGMFSIKSSAVGTDSAGALFSSY